MKIEFTFTIAMEIGNPPDWVKDQKAWVAGALESGNEFIRAMHDWIEKQPLIQGCKLASKISK